MAIKTKVLGTAAVLGSAGYVSYKSRHPIVADRPPFDSDAAATYQSYPTRPASRTSRLTAYDRKEEPMYLIPEQPTQLQSRISVLRKRASNVIAQGDELMRNAVDRVIAIEHRVERTVKSLKPRHETLLPGAIYVSIIGLSGSIISRNRMFPIRFATPLLFFVVAGKVFLPETSGNVGDLIYSWESRVPEVQKWHDLTRSHVAMGLWKAGEVVEDAEHMIDGAVKGSKEAFEKNSGIKLP